MGARMIVSGNGQDLACYYCSTSMRAFGPVMEREEAELLDVVLEAHGKDARVLDREPRNNDEGSALDEWWERVSAAFKLLNYELEDVTGDLYGHIAWSVAHDYRKRPESWEEFNALALLTGEKYVETAKERLRDAFSEWDLVF